MAVIGILVAAAIIGVISFLPIPPGGPSTVTSRITSTSTTVSTTVYTSTKISSSTAPHGTLATQIADLLSLPSGVTRVYVQYSDIEVHTSIAGSSIWVTAAPEEDVDLEALSNDGVTVGVASIPSGTYDAARFTINSAIVTFEGKNITAILPETSISVPIASSGIDLLPNATSGLLFDIAPSIIPTPSANGTQIELLPYAEALAIPSSVPPTQYARIGSVIPLASQPWFTSTQVNLADKLTVLAALVTNNALLLVVKNTGNASVTINGLSLLVPSASSSSLETQTIVTTVTTVTTITTVLQNSSAKAPAHDSSKDVKSYKALANAPQSTASLSGYQTVASFLVLSDGEVVQPSISVNAQELGLVLSPGQNASLTFIGKIQTLNSLSEPYSTLQIVPGAQYLIEVQGPFAQAEDLNVSAVAPFY